MQDDLLYPLDPQQMHAEANRKQGKNLCDQLFEALRSKIVNKVYPSGSKLASIRKLSQSLSLSRDTIIRTYDRLTAYGLIESRPGMGYFVCAAERMLKPVTPRSDIQFQQQEAWKLVLFADVPASNNYGSSCLPQSWLPEKQLSTALRASLRHNLRELGNFTEAAGYPPLLEYLCKRFSSNNLSLTREQMLLTSGAHEALGLVTASLFDVGSCVIIEAPSSFMLSTQLMSRGMQIERVPSLQQADAFDKIEALCQSRPVSAIYCSSVMGNPMGDTLSPQQTFNLLKLAEKYDFLIIDDHNYADFSSRYLDHPVSQLAAMDQFQRVIQIGGFSKVLTPQLGVGYVAAKKEIIDILLLFKSSQVLASSMFTEYAVYQLLSSREYDKSCKRIIHRLADARQHARAALQSLGLKVGDGEEGLFLWCYFGEHIDSEQLQQALYQQGYMTAPGKLFFGSEEGKAYMRFNVTRPYDPKFLKVLQKAMTAATEDSR
ncbi:PLP-dependent aminotransferase family protein [Shewanella yunxiaonensis]|uniref:PLP-dependent aminotransferase family protein n=1 Tax=Shewanella yunxiaonensis TaxID=2829809 RepID=A0ABX7YSX8_9GAMM|nr:PLP-dependent aminotransferase family protein [Shewanella yunxiaonensis]QUN05434.1 PLP-dependent aminotransferase family protein [Shewanella yunxiaonensis]